MREKYGFYSEQAAQDGIGTSFWLTPDGQEVDVTLVVEADSLDSLCETADRFKPLYPDQKYVGRVLRYIRDGKKGR